MCSSIQKYAKMLEDEPWTFGFARAMQILDAGEKEKLWQESHVRCVATPAFHFAPVVKFERNEGKATLTVCLRRQLVGPNGVLPSWFTDEYLRNVHRNSIPEGCAAEDTGNTTRRNRTEELEESIFRKHYKEQILPGIESAQETFVRKVYEALLATRYGFADAEAAVLSRLGLTAVATEGVVERTARPAVRTPAPAARRARRTGVDPQRSVSRARRAEVCGRRPREQCYPRAIPARGLRQETL